MHNYLSIDTNDQLQAYCHTLQNKDVIALDTEFIRVSTFYPKPGLFQVYDGETFALIDPLRIDDWIPFVDILKDEGIVKVFHACDEDIEIFYHYLGVRVCNVFDTQIAAAFVGFDYCMGYQRLVEKLCNINLEKSVSRSDWLKRPLSNLQIEYALLDVKYLIPLYQSLRDVAITNNMMQAISEEYQNVVDNITDDKFHQSHKRIKTAWKLNGMQLSRLKAVSVWREKIMRINDLPRNRVATNDALLELSLKPKWHRSELFGIDGLSKGVAESHADQLLNLLSDNYTPSKPLQRPTKTDKLYRRIKIDLSIQAKALSISESMLIKRPMVDAIYQLIRQKSWTLPSTISGWRAPFYQNTLATFKDEWSK